MATKLYLKSPLSSWNNAYSYASLAESVLAFVTSVTNTTASGTRIQATKTGGGTVLKWVSPPIQTQITISGTVTFNLWAKEANAANNATVRMELRQYTAGAEAGTAFAAASFGSELTTTIGSKNWTVTPTSTVFNPGDRIVAYIYIVNVGTMGAGSPGATVDYAGPTSGSDGDSWFQFTETVAFKLEAEFIQAVTVQQASPVTTVTATFTGKTVAGNLIYVAGVSVGASSMTFSDGHNTYTTIDGPTTWLGTAAAKNAFAANVAAVSPYTVTMTFGASDTGALTIAEYGGLNTSAPQDVHAVAQGSSTAANSGTSGTSTNDCILVISSVFSALATTPIAGTGYTLRSTTAAQGIEDQSDTDKTTVTGTFTVGNNSWVCQVVGFAWATQPGARISQVTTEALMQGSPHARVATVVTETLMQGSPHARVAMVVLEVLQPSSETFTWTMTANALLKKTQSTSFTADSILKKTGQASSFTANASLKRTIVASFLADAVLKRVVSASFTADAILKQVGSTHTLTVDALLKKLGITGSFTADAVLKKLGINETFFADAILKAAGVTRSMTVDGILKKAGVSGSSTVDAYLKSGTAPTFTADGILKAIVSGFFHADAILLKTAMASITADAVLKATISHSFVADAILKKTQLANFTADSILRSARIGSLHADAVLRAIVINGLPCNAVLKKNIVASLTADSILLRHVAGTFSADATLVGGSLKFFFADAVLKKIGATHTVTADALLLLHTAAQVTANATLKAAGVTHTEFADAVLKRVGGTHTFSADAILLHHVSSSTSANALLMKRSSGQIVADSILLGRITFSAAAQAVLRKTISLGFTVDAVLSLFTHIIKEFTADACLEPTTKHYTGRGDKTYGGPGNIGSKRVGSNFGKRIRYPDDRFSWW